MVLGESGLGKSTLINSLFLGDLYKDRRILDAAGWYYTYKHTKSHVRWSLPKLVLSRTHWKDNNDRKEDNGHRRTWSQATFNDRRHTWYNFIYYFIYGRTKFAKGRGFSGRVLGLTGVPTNVTSEYRDACTRKNLSLPLYLSIYIFVFDFIDVSSSSECQLIGIRVHCNRSPTLVTRVNNRLRIIILTRCRYIIALLPHSTKLFIHRSVVLLIALQRATTLRYQLHRKESHVSKKRIKIRFVVVLSDWKLRFQQLRERPTRTLLLRYRSNRRV